MTRRAVLFRQADVTRALRGALDAGLLVARVEIDRDGRIVIIQGQPDERAAQRHAAAELDQELADFEANDEGSA